MAQWAIILEWLHPANCQQRPLYLKLSQIYFIYLFIWVLTSLSTHCIGHISTGSFMDRGNQYIQLVKVLYCKLPTNGKQLPAFATGR